MWGFTASFIRRGPKTFGKVCQELGGSHHPCPACPLPSPAYPTLGSKPNRALPPKCPVLHLQDPSGRGTFMKPLASFPGALQNLPARLSTLELGLLPSLLQSAGSQQPARPAQATTYRPQSKSNTLSMQVPPFWHLRAFCSPEGTLACTVPSP